MIATTMRAFRVDPALWANAQAVASTRGETVSDVLRRALIDYTKQVAA